LGALYFVSWDAPGAPGVLLHGETAEFCDIYFARALDRRLGSTILQDETMKLLENLEKAGIQEAGVASQDAAGAAGNRKDEMDYLMIIVPLKLALVIYIAHILFH